jgi:hypothetical protein
MTPSTDEIRRRAEAEVRELDDKSFANRVRRRVENATFNRSQREQRASRQESRRRLRRREAELERGELRKAFGKKLAARIQPRGIYDVFHLPSGAIAFLDDPDDPRAFELHKRALNESGLAIRQERRGLYGWRFPHELAGTAVLAVDPTADELREIAERHRAAEPRRRRRPRPS